MSKTESPLWSVPIDEVLETIGTERNGLNAEEVKDRLDYYGPNLLRPKKRTDSLTLLLSQFNNPIIMILIFAALLAFFTSDSIDGLIIIFIILLSSILGFIQERSANNAVEALHSIVRVTSTAIREGVASEVPTEDIVPGDIIKLSAGDIIPGDCIIIESKDLFVNESALTGETYPSEKSVGVISPDATLSKRKNSLFMGTNVITGSGIAVVISTGLRTEFGKISERLRIRPPVTEFEHGINKFGSMLGQLTLLFVLAIFAFNIAFNRPPIDSFLFTLSLAVGITPSMLPVIISINLSHGARRMAKAKVIVKQLTSIENFGSMDVLCTDKTGTLTEGVIRIKSSVDAYGTPNSVVQHHAYLNALFQTAYRNPVDQALVSETQFDASMYSKLDEVPFDFVRKRLSILAQKSGSSIMITKGAVQNILDVCTHAEDVSGEIIAIDNLKSIALETYQKLSNEGYRTIGVAYRELGDRKIISSRDEEKMVFLGFVVLHDPLKPDIQDVIVRMRELGVTLKIITGDNPLIAGHAAKQLEIKNDVILTGSEIRSMSDEALMASVVVTDIFAEVEPNQKERIISALRKAGRVVGYMGDGINDASALHAADVGISVTEAVDVAKDAAQIVLLEKDLNVLIEGIEEGRKTFANTIKYVFITMSANFGNMFSMAGFSLILPYLPLLPTQILALNFISDIPATTIATDNVDPELVEIPRRWDIGFINRFMVTFGIQSTAFDYLTLAILVIVLQVGQAEFQSTWFNLSILTELFVMLIVRTRRPFIKSKPGKYLVWVSFIIFLITMLLPYTPIGLLLRLIPFKALDLVIISGILLVYVITTEVTKRFFYKVVHY